jgi:cytoskeleton protein RodZ
MSEAGGDIRAGIGTRLRAAREKKGLTLLQAAERMHVDARILEWLEAENFAALGAPVYARGHLKHYAELVDESPAQLQALYADATRSAPAQPDLTKIARGEPEPDTGRLAGPAIIGLIAIAVIGTVWWFIQTSEKAHPTTAQTQSQTHSVTQPAPTDESNATDTGNGTPGAPERAPTTPAMANTKPTTPGARTAATNTLTTSPATPKDRAGNAPSAAAATAASTSGATAPPPSPRGKEGELTLKFNADSWAEVYDATGQRLFYDVGAASSTHTVRGPAPMRVVLGNAAGVALQFNGRPAAVPASKQPDGGARFVINAHGRTVAASPASNGD